jgi:hypothetical protein
MNQMIQIPAVTLLGGLTTRALAEALLARVSANDAPSFEKLTAIPAIGQPWPGQGGIYAGVVRGREGGPDYHLILAEEGRDDIKWQPAMEWAAGLRIDGHNDFTLPWRAEQAILYGNVPELFEKGYYWSREQHAEDADYAWFQSFYTGDQSYGHESHELRARAVRRLVI